MGLLKLVLAVAGLVLAVFAFAAFPVFGLSPVQELAVSSGCAIGVALL